MSHSLRLSVIVPTYNRIDKLPRCLESIENQTLSDLEYEIIVVDDGSTDETASFLKQHALENKKNFRYISQKNSGPATARNSGIKIARGWIIWITGDDYILNPDCLQHHLDWHENKYPNENIAVLGFSTWHPDAEVSEIMHWVEHGGFQFFYDTIKHDTGISFFNFITCNISFKRSFFEKHGPFCVDFPKAMGEDTDLGIRFALGGMRFIYNQKAIAYHDHSITETESLKRVYHLGEMMALQMKLWPGIHSLPLFLPMSKLFVVYLIRMWDRLTRPFLDLLPAKVKRHLIRIVFRSNENYARNAGFRDYTESIMREHLKLPISSCVLVKTWAPDTVEFYRCIPKIREDYPNHAIVVLGDSSFLTRVKIRHPDIAWFILSPENLSFFTITPEWKSQLKQIQCTDAVLLASGSFFDISTSLMLKMHGINNVRVYNEQERNRPIGASSLMSGLSLVSIHPIKIIHDCLLVIRLTLGVVIKLLMIPLGLLARLAKRVLRKSRNR